MTKRFRAACLLTVLISTSVILCGCFGLGGKKNESALSVAYQKMQSIAKKDSSFSIMYVKKYDYLTLDFYSGADFDKIFKAINKVVKNKKLGYLQVGVKYTLEDNEIEKIDSYIGKLPCKSIKILDLSFEVLESKEHTWTNILSKVDTFRSDTLFDVNTYSGKARENLANVKKVWVNSGNFRGIESFPNVEELGLCATLPTREDTSIDNKTVANYNNSATKQFTYYDPKTGKKYTYSYKAGGDNSTVKNKSNESSTKKATTTYEFSENITEIEDVFDLKGLTKLKKIIIAPLYDKYTLDETGTKYLFTISNVRSDLLVNNPETDIKKNNYVPIMKVIDDNASKIQYTKDSVVNDFLNYEVKRVYKKAKKFKVKKKKAKINKKALIYMSKPFSTDYKSKRAFCESGSILTSKELGNKIQFPERAGDYKLFVYVYPTYKKVGRYDKGTKAYSETYYVQVFDLDKKVAYKAQKIATKQPSKKISYYGPTPPAKSAGSVSDSKVYNFIKKMK